MKTLKYILWTFLATLALAACSDDSTYQGAPEEDPDNYGVYFPDQTSSTEVERDPSEEAKVTFKVRRAKYLDAITVPVEITTSEAGILDIEPITFGPGESETEFAVTFSDAVVGTKYTCDMRIVDPHYISLYSPRATGLSFSVIRAGWELVKSADGTSTKGKWRDETISNLYSLSSASFNPYPEVEVEIYQRNDIPGYYRMKVYGASLINALAGGAVTYQGRDLYTIINASDPDKVYIPYQSTGMTLVSSDGELSIASNVAENFMMDESVGDYGTLKDGVITFPASSILLELEKSSGTFYYGNRNGMLRILLPGIVVPDYTVTLAASAAANGIVDVNATLATDAKKVKFALFEGVLDDGQASLSAQELDESGAFDGEITASGKIRIENQTTGKYTLVGCVYDASGVMRDYVFISFGYIALNDEKPVVLTLGLESTNEFAGQGINSDNSAKFYAYGEEVESVTYGLFRTDRIGSSNLGTLLDAQGTQFTAAQLTELNSGHFSTMLTGLNGNSDYTLALRANNGYTQKIFTATYHTTGTYNPAMDTFTYNDFLPAAQQPSLETLKSTTWNYYAINLVDASGSLTRRKIGQVTMEANDEQTSAQLTVLNVKGLSGIEFEEGGAIYGMYIPGSSVFSGYNGAIALYTEQALTGIYEGQTTYMGFVPEEDMNIYFGYGMFMGAVADGYLYCVPSPPAADQGYTFSYLFTGGADLYSLMTEMMLVDPAKDQGTVSSAALERIAELRKLARGNFVPRNYVELPQFNGSMGYQPAAVSEPVLNLAKPSVLAPSPRVKRVATRISVLPSASTAAAASMEKVGIQATSVKR